MSRGSTGQTQCIAEFIEKIEDQEKLYQFVQEHDQNTELIADINNCLESFAVAEVDESLYEGLFHLYKNGNQRCQLFVLQFLPALISIYLSLIGRKLAMGGGKLETLLLSVYNKEAVTNSETPFVKSYKIPSLSNSSIYHEPASTSSSALTERALSRHEQSDKPVIMKMPTKVLSRMTANTRSDVVTTALNIYNHNICAMVEPSHMSFCKMVLRLARSGFSNFDCDENRLLKVLEKSELDAIKHYTRIKLSSEVYQEMIVGLYFIMHDGLAENAIIAVESLTVMSKYLLNGALTMTLNALTDVLNKSREETELNLTRNPKRSVRRAPDIIQRRYAVSSSSLPRPAPIKDSADPSFIGTEKGSEPSRDSASTMNTLANVNNVINIKAKDESLVPLRIGKAPSESEDEAINETTTLLDNSSNELIPGKSSVICDHEMVALNIANCNDIDTADVVNDNRCYKLGEMQEDADGRIDTSL